MSESMPNSRAHPTSPHSRLITTAADLVRNRPVYTEFGQQGWDKIDGVMVRACHSVRDNADAMRDQIVELRAEVAAMRPVVNALVRFADDQWKFAGHIPDTWIGVRDAIRRCEHLDDEAGT